MKIFATLFLASLGPASAFVAPVVERRCLPLRMSDRRKDETWENKWDGVAMEVKDLAPKQNNKNMQPKKRMSKSVPFMTCPAVLDGSMGGDVGFDPLGFAKTPADLTMYREAEVKHARLAMLAAAGWPVSELFDKKIATTFGLTPILDATNRAPSVLNGGMGKINPLYWVACLVVAAAIDVYGLSRATKKKGYTAGDLGFDPFGLNPKDERGRKRMQTAEIKNGRLAMIAITAFAAQEFVAQIAVVDQTPFFFKPIWEFTQEYANSGYIIPSVETPAFVEAVTPSIDAAVTTSVEAAKAVTSSVDAVSAAVLIPPVDAVSAAAVIPPIDAVAPSAVFPPVDVVSSAAATPPVDAVSAAVVIPPVDVISSAAVIPPVDVASSTAVRPPVDDAELVAAKKRIAELESRLALIGNLSK